MRGELFKQIEDYPSYEVSSYGRVLNIKTGRTLAVVKNATNGWYFVGLRHDGRQRMVPLPRLVAEAFLQDPKDPNTSVVHRDGDRSNNHVSNLAWMPRWFVVMYMREMARPHYHRHEELVSQNTGEVFDSVAHVASVVMALPSTVFAGAYGADPTHYPVYGYIAQRHKILSYSQTFRGL